MSKEEMRSYIHPLLLSHSQAHQGGVRGDLQRGRPQVDESRRAGLRMVLVSSHDSKFPVLPHTGQGLKVGPRLSEYFRQVEAEVIRNCMNLIHQTCRCLFLAQPFRIANGVICITKRQSGHGTRHNHCKRMAKSFPPTRPCH